MGRRATRTRSQPRRNPPKEKAPPSTHLNTTQPLATTSSATARTKPTIDVYTTGGVKVAEVANNQLLTLDGELRWNGTDMHSNHLPPGLYIFHVELYHPDGESWHIKKPLLVH